ncbi:NACHT domain-containing protein [Actinoplanes sp. NPDC048967]|uniref:NACHT domain-containing protein n=1 Tax=Actinoplanes sp. NPDC048967 TaxID=3155269 RepID=UPI0033F00D89
MPVDQIVRILGPALRTVLTQALQKPPRADVAKSPVVLRPWHRLSPAERNRVDKAEIRRLLEKLSSLFGPMRQTEFANIDSAEWTAMIDAVAHTIADGRSGGRSRYSDLTPKELIMATGLQPDFLCHVLLTLDAERPAIAGLSELGTQAYRRLLHECCVQLVEYTASRPEFVRSAGIETIRRLEEIRQEARDRQLAAEQDTAEARFERSYLRRVAVKLNQLRLFGVTVNRAKPYPLSTAYLNLTVTRAAAYRVPKGGSSAFDAALQAPSLRVDEAFGRTRRVLVRGEAGSGKTTLLQWLAVVLAARSPETPPGWEGKVPFLLPLRRYAATALPHVDDFAREAGVALAGGAPDGWIRKVLQHGDGVVLIDGVDELPEVRREEIRSWLADLVDTFPTAHFVVTSRPPAAPNAWLESDNFESLTLLPMTQPDVRLFISYWHLAMGEAAGDKEMQQRLADDEGDLIEKMAQRRSLRQLATNPLLCALICALHHDRLRDLPRDRNTLYRAALEMLLVRRDRERAVVALDITQDQQEEILQRLGYWMLRNRLNEVDRNAAEERIRSYLKGMGTSTAPGDVLTHLVTRSGVLGEPVEGRVDFIHRTFQDYLAAHALIDDGDLHVLVHNAHDPAWRDTAVMAMGIARRRERDEILRRLCARADAEPPYRRTLELLAGACLEQATSVDPKLEHAVRERLKRIMRPTSADDATELAQVGDIIFDLIPDPAGLSELEIGWFLHAVRGLGGDDSIPVLAALARNGVPAHQADLAATWPEDVVPEHYVDLVLKEVDADAAVFHAVGERRLQALTALPAVRRLKVSDVSGKLVALADFPLLERLELERCNEPVVDALSHLRELRLYVCQGSSQLLRGSLSELQELHILGGDGCAPENLARLRGLRRLVFDVTLTHGMWKIPKLPELRSVALLSGPSFASCLDLDYQWAAGSQASGTVQRHDLWAWRRPTFDEDISGRGLTEVSLAGWPSELELSHLGSCATLRTLRVIVPTDDTMHSFKATNFKDYPYPAFEAGVTRTLKALPALPALRICLVERFSARRAGIATILQYAGVSSSVMAQMGDVPSDSPAVQVSVNGVRLDRDP